ncbi:Transcriptional regulator SlyA [Methylobacterium crusticola]|uniref:Transcriptional regulator SlyA n=1 Tax=Methylobacterium crusticola TaxID=1697972 RepID=A0ABQ4R8I6_9HYPH|nr:MarR family winged helix-turn-helix transcriptional regulator [Methylobacterium crusticola]GJD53465.1 Transcriptional regulator SlyA [Methylobacterium crusticola]
MDRGREDEAGAGAPRLDLAAYVPALLTFLANKLTRTGSALYRARFGVGITEWRILSLLALEPGITANRICQVIGFDKGPVSRSVAFLADRDLVTVETDAADARRHRITLTAAGLALHDRIIRVALERERRLLAPLSPEERRVLVGLLNRLHDNLGAVSAPIPDVPPVTPPGRERLPAHPRASSTKARDG